MISVLQDSFATPSQNENQKSSTDCIDYSIHGFDGTSDAKVATPCRSLDGHQRPGGEWQCRGGQARGCP